MTAMLKGFVRALLPPPILSAYHLVLAYLGALVYGFPSRELTVIAVTGTKGKSSVAELIFRILREAGYHVGLLSTIRFAVDEESEPNLFKMTLRGRFFVQRFLASALERGATHVVVEITSEAVVQWRHRFLELDALVFTNLAREHIESHGSFEKYAEAKLALARHLQNSPKRPRIVVANRDDAQGERFLSTAVEHSVPYRLSDAAPYVCEPGGSRFTWKGSLFELPLAGEFNIMNALAALNLCEYLGVSREVMQRALARVKVIPGRAETISLGQDFTVVVDYAHTSESLEAIYSAFQPIRQTSGSISQKKLICVLGNTGGGRDRWKRKIMGGIADKACAVAILTDEDPYDEDPRAILDEMAEGFSHVKPLIILDRREAIRTALRNAKAGDRVIITGKGTDPFIMRVKGAKEPWSDKRVVEEELERLLKTKN